MRRKSAAGRSSTPVKALLGGVPRPCGAPIGGAQPGGSSRRVEAQAGGGQLGGGSLWIGSVEGFGKGVAELGVVVQRSRVVGVDGHKGRRG